STNTSSYTAFFMSYPTSTASPPPRRRRSCSHDNKGALMRYIKLSLITSVAILALAAPTFASTHANTLTGTVGPGFTITMSKKIVKHGAYVITIHDRSAIHNFHLTGPGVNKKTSIPGV